MPTWIKAHQQLYLKQTIILSLSLSLFSSFSSSVQSVRFKLDGTRPLFSLKWPSSLWITLLKGAIFLSILLFSLLQTHVCVQMMQQSNFTDESHRPLMLALILLIKSGHKITAPNCIDSSLKKCEWNWTEGLESEKSNSYRSIYIIFTRDLNVFANINLKNLCAPQSNEQLRLSPLSRSLDADSMYSFSVIALQSFWEHRSFKLSLLTPLSDAEQVTSLMWVKRRMKWKKN